MSLENTGTQIPEFEKSEELISADDTHCLQSVLEQEEAAQKAFNEAQAQYVKAVGAKEFIAARLQKKYKLEPGDSIQRDGVIVRAE